MAVLVEDFAACLGNVIAGGGLLAVYLTDNVMWDGVASLGIGCIIGASAYKLAKINQKYLIGQVCIYICLCVYIYVVCVYRCVCVYKCLNKIILNG